MQSNYDQAGTRLKLALLFSGSPSKGCTNIGQNIGPVLTLTLGFLCAAGTLPAHADLPAERTARDAPAPHLGAAGTKQTLVQYATLKGHVEGTPGNGVRLQQLKDSVPACVQMRQNMGMPVNPPTEWPQHINGMRTDVYVTERFEIAYNTTWAYMALGEDCSIYAQMEPSRTAVLRSKAGTCRINLINKTAKGKCDLAVHKVAAIRPRAVPLTSPARIILGLACRDMAFLDTTHCIAQGGSFLPAFSLVIDRQSEHGVKMVATDANLELRVSEAVFTPHLASGFKIEEAAQP